MLYWIELQGWNEMNSRVRSKSERTEMMFDHVTKVSRWEGVRPLCGPKDVQGPWRIQGSSTGSWQWPYYIQDWIGSVEQSLIRIPYPDFGQYGDPEGEPGFRLLAGREGLGLPGNKIISITSTRCIHRKCVCWCMNSWIISSIHCNFHFVSTPLALMTDIHAKSGG